MITMKKTVLFALVALALFVVGCKSAPEDSISKELEGTVKTEVLEHKGSALGINELPIWVETYVQQGITGLEKLPDYTEDYCFVAETSATDINAAQAWVNGFDMPQTIARNVSTRVEAVFSGAATGSTDGEYDTYFENIVKTTTDTNYSGARKVNDWWVLTRRYDNDVEDTYTDEYRAYVLYTIPRDLLDQQVVSIIDNVAQNLSVSDENVNKVKDLLSEAGL